MPAHPRASSPIRTTQAGGIDRRDVARYLAMATVIMMGLAGCHRGNSGPPASLNGQSPDGTVDMHQVQAAYIGSAGGGSGTLFFRGRAYPFSVGGLGIGGIGVSTVDATGEVYSLHDVAQFAGAYAQGSYGFVIGTTSAGDLWLQNESGVIMHLRAKREGLMLSLGGSGVVVTMNQ